VVWRESEKAKQQEFVLLKLQKQRQSARHLVHDEISIDTRTFVDLNSKLHKRM
jgi:hypothetical protein